MYPVSSAYAAAVKQLSRLWDLKLQITTTVGEVLELDKSNISLGSFSFKEGATCADTVQVGSTFSNSIEFELINKNKQFNVYDFTGARVVPQIGLWLEESQAFEYVPLGEFFVLENGKRFSTIPFSCFDRMSLATRVFDDSQIVYPTALTEVFAKAATQCGATVSATLLAEVEALGLTVNSLPADTVSCRDIFTGIGVLIAKNLRMNRAGYLESFWYTAPVEPEGATSPQTRTGNSEFEDTKVAVTGCYLSDAYGNAFSVGTDTYAIELPSSPIIQGEEMSMMALNAALTRLKQFEYQPAEVYTIGDPAIQAGDVVIHRDTAVGTVTLPVMTSVYKFPGYGILTTLGIPRTSLDQQSSTDKKFKQAFARSSKDRAILESKIAQTAEQVLLKVSETYADWESFAQLSVEVDEIAGTVQDNSNNISQLIQQAGMIKLRVKTADGELVTTIDANSWEAVHTNPAGEVLSGFYFDFELGQFVFDGTGVYRAKNMNTFMTLEGKEMILYKDSDLDALHLGFQSNGDIDYPYLLMGNAGGDGGKVGLVKKFINGIWVGNSYPRFSFGHFEAKENYAGFFIDTVNRKTYVVDGTDMKNVYTGAAIAKFK